MAIATTQNKLPTQVVPFLNDDGRVSLTWYRFFSSFFGDVEGSGDDAEGTLLLPASGDPAATAIAALAVLERAPSTYAHTAQIAALTRVLEDLALAPVQQPALPSTAVPSGPSSLRAMHFQRSGPLTLFPDTPLEMVWESTYQEPGTAALQMANTGGLVTTTAATPAVFSFQLYLILDAGADIEVFFNLCDVATPPNGNVDDFEMPAYGNVTASRAGRWIVPSPKVVRMQTGSTRARVRVTLRTAPGTPQLRCTGASLVVTQEK